MKLKWLLLAIPAYMWLKVSPPSKRLSVHSTTFLLEEFVRFGLEDPDQGCELVKLVLAGYSEIEVSPMTHFQHDHPYLCRAGLPWLLGGPHV